MKWGVRSVGASAEDASTPAPAAAGPVWVGVLDLDEEGPVTGINGSLGPKYQQARILVRLHRAPLGFVWVPAMPEESLTARSRAIAEATLVDALRGHAELDDEGVRQGVASRWEAQMACPRHFPDQRGEGISVIVCTRNRPALLPDSLGSLMRSTYDPLEILVVDNAPSDSATRDIVTALAADDPRVRYTCEPRPGKSLALNHGLAEAKFEIAAVTDDDALADPGWLSAVAAAFEADPGTVCVTGMVASSALSTGSERYFDARYSWGEGFQPRRFDLDKHRHDSPFYPFSAGIFGTGANCAFRRRAVEDIGGFDPLLGAGGPQRGGADLDIFLRLILAGGRITYLPSALIWHRHRANPRALAEQMYTYGHGLGAYLGKHLSNRELRGALLRHGLSHAGRALGRQRSAARSGQLGIEGKRLAVYEAFGIVPGAVRYWLAARRASEPPVGE